MLASLATFAVAATLVVLLPGPDTLWTASKPTLEPGQPVNSFWVCRQSYTAGKPVQGISGPAARLLMDYDWPGNVRELENTIERAVVLSRGTAVELDDLPVEVRTGQGNASDGRSITFAIGTPLGEIERRVIHATLGHVGGDKRLCAQLLGIATRTIYRRLEEEKEGTPPENAEGKTDDIEADPS